MVVTEVEGLQQPPEPYAVITVGTTQFPMLMDALNAHADRIIACISSLGCSHILLQHGSSPCPSVFRDRCAAHPTLTLQHAPYHPALTTLTQAAAVVIAHAGAGTILEVLRSPRTPAPRLCVVTNPQLMDNHQQDLATELAAYLIAAPVSAVAEALEGADWDALLPFPQREVGAVPRVLAQEAAIAASGEP